MCKSFIKSGVRGCNRGPSCSFFHPRLCPQSLHHNQCIRKSCFLYHVTGSERPNYIPLNLEQHNPNSRPQNPGRPASSQRNSNPKTSSRPVQYCPNNSDYVRSHDLYAEEGPNPRSDPGNREHYNPNHFPNARLDSSARDRNVSDSIVKSFRPNEGTSIPNFGPATANVPILCNNSKIRSSFPTSSSTTLSALQQSLMGPPAGPSQLIPNDQTNITDCASTYSFFSLNVARLLENNSVNKSKINFLNDLSDESTLFVALCETFLNDNIFDTEIQMQGYIVCRTDRLSRPGGGVCFYIKTISNFPPVCHSLMTCVKYLLLSYLILNWY